MSADFGGPTVTTDSEAAFADIAKTVSDHDGRYHRDLP
jgi:hypothetical protein